MLFDLSLIVKNAIGSVAFHQDTNMPSLSPADDSNHSSRPCDAMPSRSRGSPIGSNRSSSIPLPSTHVARTQSELQLCMDEEVAEQRDTNMFYRLVNGIRERQTSPTRDMDGTYSERSIAGIFHARLASHMEVNEHNSSLDHAETPAMWQMLDSTRGRVSDGTTNDEWSISGFDYQHEKPSASANTTLHRGNDHEDDEGVFSLDM